MVFVLFNNFLIVEVCLLSDFDFCDFWCVLYLFFIVVLVLDFGMVEFIICFLI